MSRFEELSPRIYAAVKAGASVEDACRKIDISAATVRDWLRKGRANPDGVYGIFADNIDRAKAAQRLPADASTPGAMSRDEWEACLANAIRSGSVAAMRLWFDTHADDHTAADPFAEIDRLAGRGA